MNNTCASNIFIHKLEQLIEAYDILSMGQSPIALISPTTLTHMLDQVKAALQKTHLDYTLLFPESYYYYDMKLVSFGYDRTSIYYFNFHFSLNHTPKNLWLYVN